MIFLISCIVTLSLNYVNHTMSINTIVKYFAIFFGIVMIMRVVQVYSMYYGIAKMYDKSELRGHNSVISTKDFILLYATARQCSVIRKKDVENIDEFLIYLQDKFKKVYRTN